MKLTRLSLIMLAIVMSLLAAPDAFGKPRKGGKVTHSTANDCDYYIWCYYEPIEACCYGDFEFCNGACEDLCGGPCDYYET